MGTAIRRGFSFVVDKTSSHFSETVVCVVREESYERDEDEDDSFRRTWWCGNFGGKILGGRLLDSHYQLGGGMLNISTKPEKSLHISSLV